MMCLNFLLLCSLYLKKTTTNQPPTKPPHTKKPNLPPLSAITVLKGMHRAMTAMWRSRVILPHSKLGVWYQSSQPHFWTYPFLLTTEFFPCLTSQPIHVWFNTGMSPKHILLIFSFAFSFSLNPGLQGKKTWAWGCKKAAVYSGQLLGLNNLTACCRYGYSAVLV